MSSRWPVPGSTPFPRTRRWPLRGARRRSNPAGRRDGRRTRLHRCGRVTRPAPGDRAGGLRGGPVVRVEPVGRHAGAGPHAIVDGDDLKLAAGTHERVQCHVGGYVGGLSGRREQRGRR